VAAPFFWEGLPIPVLATLTIDYEANPVVPEPGTVLLLGAGVAGLATLGRKRRAA
jgi:hypothetical protein